MKNFLCSETSQGVIDIYVSTPDDSTDKLPVVIVLMEAYGVNHHIRSVCDRLAQEGFLVASPDLYHRSGKRIEIDYSQRQEIFPLMSQLTNEGIIYDIRETINFLDNLPHADLQNVSTIGFCVGGFASALAATKLNIKNMISFYGGGIVHARDGFKLKPILDDLPKIKSRCLFFFGGQDASIPKSDQGAIQEKLHPSKVRYELVVYEKSDHGFFCDERKAYDQEASNRAWEKTLSFLKK